MTAAQTNQKENSAAAPKAGAKIRVALIGEDTCPVAMGASNTWNEQLVNGLPDYHFEIVKLVGDQSIPVNLSKSPARVSTIPVGDPPSRARLTGRKVEEQRVKTALNELWNAALPKQDPEQSHIMQATSALKELARGTRHQLAATLHRINSAALVAEAWSRHRSARPELPHLTAAQAEQVAHYANQFLAVLDVSWPQVDICHVTSNGPAVLVGLARYWRDGSPLLLTEHGVCLRERYQGLEDLGLAHPVRTALLGLSRVVCQVAYAEAAKLLPVNEFLAKWARQLGADKQRMHTVHYGVDAEAFPEITTEPEVPTVSFVGPIDPSMDLATMIRAFATVTQRIPEAKLRIFGKIPKQKREYYQQLTALVEELKLGNAVSFEDKEPNTREAAEAGHLVALSSVSERVPFSVLEAMACARATISTDVGGTREITGHDGLSGALVPRRSPEALAKETIRLLLDGPARRRMGFRARERAMEKFPLELFLNRMRDEYRQVLAPAPVSAAAVVQGGTQQAAKERPSMTQHVLPALKTAARQA